MINIILLFIVFLLLLFLSMIWPPDSPWAPWWRTNKENSRVAARLAKVKPSDIVYELGSGDAEFLMVAAGEFGAKGVGIEIDPLRVWISKVLIRLRGLSGKIKIIKGNFSQHDLSGASVVFMYLVPRALERLRPKLEKELKKGTRIVSFRYEMNLPLVASDKKHRLYMYKI